jgi:hypothetical protein
MKNKLKCLTCVAPILLGVVSTAYADFSRIESPRGITQSAWNASDTYKNFQCPAGTGRGEGVDMNFTTDRSDDYYFVTCETIVQPKQILLDTPTVTAIQPTVNVVTPIANVVDTNTIKVDTTTSVAVKDNYQSLLSYIRQLINQLLSLIASIKHD